MKPITIIGALLLICFSAIGQNLVPNANFSEYKDCPTIQMFTPDAWQNPLNPAFGSTPDYFNECAGNIVGVPTNFLGFQEAATGGAYAGLATYQAPLGFREYIQANLISPTIAGACYRLTIVYCPTENAGFSDKLGMFLSNGAPDNGYPPQDAMMEKLIVQESNEIWHTLTTDYISPGGENLVTIGNFNGNGDTNHIPNGDEFPEFGYYYIDSVAVERISEYSEDLMVDIGEDMEVCASDFPITLVSNFPDDTNTWSTGETGSSIEVNAPGKYYLEVFMPCVYSIDSMEITVIEDPDFSVESATICAGDSVLLQVDGSLGEYEWEDGTLGPEFYATEVGTFSVTLSHTCGEIVRYFSINEIYDIEIPPPLDIQICETELPIVAQFAAFDDGINQFEWQDGFEAPGYLITEAGDYGVLIYNECFSDSVGFNVDVDPAFPSTVDFVDTIACEGDEKEIIIAFEGVDYLWHDGSTDSSFLAEGPGLYSVTVSNYCGEQIFDFEIDEAPVPDFDLGSDRSICPGDSVLIVNQSGTDVMWSTGEISPEIWVKEEIMIVGTVDGFCAEVSDTIMVSLDGTVPEVSLPDSLLLCSGDTILITALANANSVDFEWNTGSDSSEIEVFTEGIYIVSAENNCGIVSDSVVVILGEALPDPALQDVYEICEGEILELMILANGGIVEWSTGDMDSTITISEAGNYSVALTNSCKTKTDSFIVSYIPQIANIDLGLDVGICENGSTTLEYSGVNGNYIWSTGSENESIEITAPGEYWLEISGTCNVVRDTIEILDLGTVPIIDLGPDLSFCDGDTVELSVLGADVDEILWNTSSEESTITVFEAGTFIVIGSNVCGTDTDTVQTTINNEVPVIDLGSDQIICPGDSVLLETGIGGDIEWSTGDEGSSIYVSESGVYIAMLNSSCGESIDSIAVEIADAAPTIDLGDDVELCEGNILEFDLAIGPGINIIWNNGDEDGENSYSESGTIWLELSNSCGEDRDSLELNVIPMIEPFALPDDITLCDGESFLVESNITQDDLQLEWNTSEIGGTLEVTETGIYWLDATNACFTLTDSIYVDAFDSAQAFDLGMNDTICSGESILLSGDQGAAFNYEWQDGSESTEYVVTESGTYILNVSNECGTVSNEVDILVLSADKIEIPLEESYVLCDDFPLSIDLSSVIASSILWNDGSNELERLLEEPGLYFVELINACSDTTFFFEFEQKNCLVQTIYTPNSFTPNEDGVNDFFSIFFPENWLEPKITVQLYNRWGEQIFYSEDPYFQWAGNFKGKSLNPGVYAYYYELEVEIDGERKVIRDVGDVTIVR